jgi:hypothetical protein
MSGTFPTARIRSELLPRGRLLPRSTRPLGDHPAGVVHERRLVVTAAPPPCQVVARG